MRKTEEPQPRLVLTPEQAEAMRNSAEFLKHLPTDYLEKLISKITVSPIINTLPDRFYQSLTVMLEENGKLFPAIRVANPNFADTRIKEPNLDFTPVWEQKNLKLSLNTVKGFLSFATHGLEAQMKPFVKQELKPYDVDNLLSILLAKHLAQRDDSWRSKKWKVPKQLRFSKKIRKRTQKVLDELKAIERRWRQEEKMVDHSSTIYG
jgi:hypothetical protein